MNLLKPILTFGAVEGVASNVSIIGGYAVRTVIKIKGHHKLGKFVQLDDGTIAKAYEGIEVGDKVMCWFDEKYNTIKVRKHGSNDKR
jgi:hypothetical protein